MKLISAPSLCSLSLSAPSQFAFACLTSSPLLFCFLTRIAPYQPLSLSAAGIGEGEGKPGGADGALL